MKSPTESTASGSSSVHTDASSTRYKSSKDLAEAHFAKLRVGLKEAVKEAEENAHLDCAGMNMEGLLEELRASKETTNDEEDESEEGADEEQDGDDEGGEEEEAEVDDEEEEAEEDEGEHEDQEDEENSEGEDEGSNDDSPFEGTEDEAASDPTTSDDDGGEGGGNDETTGNEDKEAGLQLAIANTTRNSNLYESQGV